MTRPTEKKIAVLRLVPALALAVGMITPSAAFAWLPYQSGAACMPKNSTEAAKVEYDHTNGLGNKSTSNATVYCPIVYSGSEGSTYAEVWISDQHPTANATCSVKGRDRKGEFAWSSGNVSTSGASATAQAMNWISLPVEEYMIAFTMSCTLPPVSNGKISRLHNFGVDFQD
ncbi:MAG: hypothetical protein H7X95_00250 [Deltaproteobacteria bacterium]|nr:hypothetical protein [Deltaproteobacteria bacterium]